MTASHDEFEVLCTLSASEALTEMELLALRRHAAACTICRDRILEMAQLQSQLLLAHAFQHRNGRLPGGMRKRFVARAIEAGVPLTRPSTVGISRLGLASVLLAVLLIMAAGVDRIAPTRSIASAAEAPVTTAMTVSARPATQVASGSYVGKPAAIALSVHAGRRKGYLTRTPQRSFPRNQWVFESRNFTFRLNTSLDTSTRSRFATPSQLGKSHGLNLLANFQAAGSSSGSTSGSRTFEFSGNYIYRFLPISRWESR